MGDPCRKALGAGKLVVHVKVEEITGQSGEADDMRFGHDNVAGLMVVTKDEILEPVFAGAQQSRLVARRYGHSGSAFTILAATVRRRRERLRP